MKEWSQVRAREQTDDGMPLDSVRVALLLQHQGKCTHVGYPFERLALRNAHCNLGVVFKHRWIVAILRAGQRWINEVVVRVLWSVVLCCGPGSQKQPTQQAYGRLHVQRGIMISKCSEE